MGHKSVLIDTNLLVLLMIGYRNPDYVRFHKRTASIFDVGDFTLLNDFLIRYQSLWVTAHCLAESSNLLRQTDKYRRREIMTVFSQFVARLRESHLSIHKLGRDAIISFGVSDAGMVQKARRVDTVLTVDVNLYVHINKQSQNAINFRHLSQGIAGL